MNVFPKPGDSPEVLAAKARVRAGYERVASARTALETAQTEEARARFELHCLVQGRTEGAVYALNKDVGVLRARRDCPYCELLLFKKDGTYSDRKLPLNTLEHLVPSRAPSSVQATAKRATKLKVWVGNYDGRQQAAVAATSVDAARYAVNASAKDFRSYFRESPLDTPELAAVVAQPGALFVRPLYPGTKEAFTLKRAAQPAT